MSTPMQMQLLDTRARLGLVAFASLQNYGKVRFVGAGDWMEDIEKIPGLCPVCENWFVGYGHSSVCRVCVSLLK